MKYKGSKLFLMLLLGVLSGSALTMVGELPKHTGAFTGWDAAKTILVFAAVAWVGYMSGREDGQP